MFSLARFLRLARAQWAEQGRVYLWFLAAGAILHVFILMFYLASEEGWLAFTTDDQASHFYIGLFLLAPIFAGRYFAMMARRDTALLVLVRPASTLEKWLLAVATVALAYPLAFSLVYYLIDLPAAFLANSAAAEALARPGIKAGTYDLADYQLFNPLAKLSWEVALEITLILGTLQAFAMFGSLYFRTMPFIKTLFAAFMVLLAVIFLAVSLDASPEILFSFWSGTVPKTALQENLFPLIWFGAPALLWFATYRVLKEREISP